MADQTFASCHRKFKGLLLPGPNFSASRKERGPRPSRWGLEEIIRRGSFIARTGRSRLGCQALNSASLTSTAGHPQDQGLGMLLLVR